MPGNCAPNWPRYCTRGYALGNEDAGSGVRTIASPFFGSDDEVAGAIGIAGPATRFTRRNLNALPAGTERSNQTLSNRLGSARALPCRGLRLVRR